MHTPRIRGKAVKAHIVRAASILAVLSLGCRDIVARDCNAMGCFNGLRVSFATQPTVAFTVEVSNGTGGATYTFECPNPTQCSGALFPDYLPERVFITVTTARGSQRTEATPEYQVQRPNGPFCSPSCRNAQVTVPLP